MNDKAWGIGPAELRNNIVLGSRRVNSTCTYGLHVSKGDEEAFCLAGQSQKHDVRTSWIGDTSG